MTPTPKQPSLAELMSTFLVRQSADRATGIGELSAREVEPFEAAFAPLVDPRTAWDEATAALCMLNASDKTWKVAPPTEWTALATSTEGVLAVALAAGNYPQLVKDLPLLAREKQRSRLSPTARAEFPAPGLRKWVDQAVAQKNIPQVLIGIGVLRTASHLDAAEGALNQVRSSIPAAWKPAFVNEETALMWERGRGEEALRLWKSLPDGAVACFNRGMALLFLDRAKEARAELQTAVKLIPEENAWHHLGRLYLTLTEI